MYWSKGVDPLLVVSILTEIRLFVGRENVSVSTTARPATVPLKVNERGWSGKRSPRERELYVPPVTGVLWQ